ncbi:hypothetical protein HNQ57_003552 [Zhongshania antarctica]|uniref:Uncharacterized protein n=1 Tax=Zhongshania antarctica TaxID=641702 RepID=A0A840R7F9_9GAMM|nr:hypothetical protein [Zhongshania antarctica]
MSLPRLSAAVFLFSTAFSFAGSPINLNMSVDPSTKASNTCILQEQGYFPREVGLKFMDSGYNDPTQCSVRLSAVVHNQHFKFCAFSGFQTLGSVAQQNCLVSYEPKGDAIFSAGVISNGTHSVSISCSFVCLPN